MRMAVFKIMALSLIRDRGALVMSFVLPGIVFAIFALIFSGASGGELAIRLAVADERNDADSRQVVDALFKNEKLKQIESASQSRRSILSQVRDGSVDIGLVIRAGSVPLLAPATDDRPHFELITDPSREIASSMVSGLLQNAYMSLVPASAGQPALFVRTSASRHTAKFSPVSYYAGAVAMMFLLFASLSAALSYLEELESGLLSRIASGPGGVGIVLDGKFAFMVLQGWLQVLVVFLVAWLAFGLDLPGHLLTWAITTLAGAFAAAGLAIAFVTFCRTKKQAETLGQMIVLVVSAIGGSMVPRFLMPPEIQSLGWLTPNAWALEAYASVFWRGDSMEALLIPWIVLSAIGVLGLAAARINAMSRG
ncbi:MAG: ABC transporter permease [Hyphomicrobiaceae bacterium]